MAHTASCHCGALRATIAGEPLAVNVCHCRDCQRMTGSAFSYNAYFDRTQVQVEGASRIYTRNGPEGRQVRFRFCPECGGKVWWDFDLRPDLSGLSPALFEGNSFPPPTYSIWEQSKESWVGLPGNWPHFQCGSVR
jgi:hypothetical protein